ncbi:MAG: hypothetical protein MZV63_19765 [Marinilabiliales bacterium]|nr:hypothetical protein [Marinilabiliales bacterium]
MKSLLKSLQDSCPNENVSYLTMDISAFEKENEAVKDQIYNRFSRVDILINIAGLLVVERFFENIRSGSTQYDGNQFFRSGSFY